MQKGRARKIFNITNLYETKRHCCQCSAAKCITTPPPPPAKKKGSGFIEVQSSTSTFFFLLLLLWLSGWLVDWLIGWLIGCFHACCWACYVFCSQLTCFGISSPSSPVSGMISHDCGVWMTYFQPCFKFPNVFFLSNKILRISTSCCTHQCPLRGPLGVDFHPLHPHPRLFECCKRVPSNRCSTDIGHLQFPQDQSDHANPLPFALTSNELEVATKLVLPKQKACPDSFSSVSS